ncbi:MAG: OmpA family protein [Bacteroidales bacterium]|nr:OmpA family protein [Bacteroidales bacterium]
MSLSAVYQNAAAQTHKLVKAAEEAVYNEDWGTAINCYKQVVELKPEKPVYHTNLGECYFNHGDKKEALAELYKAQALYPEKKHKKIAYQTNELLIARVLRESDSLQEATDKLLSLDASKKKVIKMMTAEERELCEFAKSQKAAPKDYLYLNLGAFVNTEYADHSPVLSADGKTLYFTSRRPINGAAANDGGQSDENVFISTLVDSTQTWGTPVPVKGDINTNFHDAIISLSPDGNEMYLYRDDENGTIMVSKKNGDSWSAPEALPETINTAYVEKGAALSPDGSKLYFASNRKGGFGGLDLYVSKREGDSWGKAVNLGPSVNTAKDEEGPYVSKDGSQLYFSSKGHKSMGGYDIFTTPINGDSYGEPENFGYPVNTSEDELYIIEVDKKVYFSSRRDGGLGQFDIYASGPTAIMQTPITIIDAKVKKCLRDSSVFTVGIKDYSTGNSSEVVTATTGEFVIVSRRGHNYGINLVDANGNTVYSELFDVAYNAEDTIQKTILMPSFNPQDCIDDQYVAVKNPDIDPKRYDDEGNLYDTYVEIEDITFDLCKTNLVTNEGLQKLRDHLSAHENAKVKVRGYADASGSASRNVVIAGSRAAQARNYLLATKKVKPNQVTIESMGEENPLTKNYRINNTDWDKPTLAPNRRVEFIVTQQDSTQTLLIRPIRVNTNALELNPDYKRDAQKANGTPETKEFYR